MSDNAAICIFFDLLVEGQIDQDTGEYEIELLEEEDYEEVKKEVQTSPKSKPS